MFSVNFLICHRCHHHCKNFCFSCQNGLSICVPVSVCLSVHPMIHINSIFHRCPHCFGLCFCYGTISYCIVINNICPYASLALVQSYDFSSASDITLKDVGEMNGHQTTKTQWRLNHMHNNWDIHDLFLFFILRERYIDMIKTKLSRRNLCSYFMGYAMHRALTYLLPDSLDSWHGKP